MAEEEKKDQETPEAEATEEDAPQAEDAPKEPAAEEEAPVEEPTPAAEAGEEAAEAEDAKAGEGAEGGADDASDEVADDAEVPAATEASQPGDTGAGGEDVDGDIPPHPKELRKRRRSHASGPARAPRSPEERAAERIERRRAAAEGRRRYRTAKRAKRGEKGEGTPRADREPGARKVRQGSVVSTGGDKTITVEIAVVRRHPTYEKVVRRTSRLRAHDERNEAGEGDVVRVVECRPISRTKRWRLVEILERAPR